jgi:hypothetical protein
MSNLYGVETTDDCREKLDELLELCHQAQERMNKDTIKELKVLLQKYYKAGSTNKGQERMSRLERSHFLPAIQDAYVKAPSLNSRETWENGLYEVESSLRHYLGLLKSLDGIV